MFKEICCRRTWLIVLALMALTLAFARPRSHSSDQHKRLDPAAWGIDHVGKPVPEYVTGGECLFCHRQKVGPTWGANRHNLTIRVLDDKSAARVALQRSPLKELAKEIKFVMGHSRRQRFLKPAKAFGKLELLSCEWIPPKSKKPGKLFCAQRPHWNAKLFGSNCAGCHATGVDSKSQTFSTVSIDCFVCHGNVNPDHSKKPELVHLSKKRKDPARVVIAICAQCHIRSGKSKSSGLPYPNNFVAGDNLFLDFQMDFSDAKINSLSTADRHILRNVRDVVVLGKNDVTCLSCHNVHSSSGKKHRRMTKSAICLDCHHGKGSWRILKPFTAHSKTCDILK